METTPDFSELQKKWLIEEKHRLEDDKKRRYLHFDPRVYGLSEQHATKIFDSGLVARHPFYPFVRDDQKRRKHKRIEGKRVIELKIRPISYAAHSDALIYSYYNAILNDAYEKELTKAGISQNVLAYRRTGKSTLDFASEVFGMILKTQDCVAICFDVKGFFDNLDHAILKSQWQKALGTDRLPEDHFAIYKSVTKFSYVRKEKLMMGLVLDKRKLGKMERYCSLDDFHKKVRKGKLIEINSERGIPQGAPISSVLSNIYMFDFDLQVAQQVSKLGGLYRRYCDDIITVVRLQDKKGIEKFILDKINELKLEISAEKTERVEFRKDQLIIEARNTKNLKRLQYLGLEFDGKNIYLRHRGLASFQGKMASGIRGASIWAKKNNKGIIPKRSVYEKFSVYSRQNYLIYARRAAEKLNSPTIAHQVRPSRVMRLLKGLIKKEAIRQKS
ncbi:MAG: antiviral reverse transcriptase Drt2 [Candidatus Liptonbacteria bacterium]|nr:antiviral reverse transcriptase Drt2 [Candidatus Liptonbacteria bacterium]